MRYKCANCETEFNHQALTCPVCHSDRIYQSLVDQDPDDLNSVVTRDAQKTFHRPSTNLGNFDIHYSAARHLISITVRIHPIYDDRYYKVLSDEDQNTHLSLTGKLLRKIQSTTDTAPSAHKKGVLSEFTAAAKKAIPLTWNNRFEIVHKRFSGPPIKIEFALEESDLQSSHYEVEIIDANEHISNQATVLETGGTPGTSYHRAMFTSDVSGPSGANYKREQIIGNLVAGYKIPFPNYSASSPAPPVASSSSARHPSDHTSICADQDERAGKQLLREFATEFRRVIAGTDYKKFKILVEIKAPINRTGSLLEYLFSELAPQETEIARRNIRHLFGPPGSAERYIKISIASVNPACTTLTQHVRQIMLDTNAPSPAKACPAQITICHEFGHMLGLPDEYVCISHSAENNLRHLGMNVFRSDHSFESWNELQLPNPGQRMSDVVRDNQKRFLLLCDRADLPPPLFGHSTTSLMSAGSVLHEHHAVTILEAFCACMGGATQIDDWKVRML